uniref:Uncharacterized protein n=1 Tax=Oryza brachyantha TaxID=4533 RepID=J3M5C7_ORYBR
MMSIRCISSLTMEQAYHIVSLTRPSAMSLHHLNRRHRLCATLVIYQYLALWPWPLHLSTVAIIRGPPIILTSYRSHCYDL